MEDRKTAYWMEKILPLLKSADPRKLEIAFNILSALLK